MLGYFSAMAQLLIAIGFVIGNLITDVMLATVDPRIRFD